ncbi:MAG: helix-turn-helix domain-containing protein [Acidobacteriota bacterium]
MDMRKKMELLIGEMLDGRILLDEAITEFEKIYIQKALWRNSDHLCNTAVALGIHRNTLSKRVAGYNGKPKASGKTPSKSKKNTRKVVSTKTRRR